MPPMNETQDQIDTRKRERERQAWGELYRTYMRCIEIADAIWGDRLQDAQADQAALAETMADRLTGTEQWSGDSAIRVPLFTPRDRQQFIKEVAATLLISADRKNLTVLFPNKEQTDGPTQPQAPESTGVEAASGADKTAVDAETTTGAPA